MNRPFSKRQGLNNLEKEISIRNDAPQELREYIIQTVESLGCGPAFSRQVICRVLRKVPDRDNWTPYPNIYNEVVDLMTNCEWFYVYDIIEEIYEKIKPELKERFEIEINDYFILNGIGWKLKNGLIEYRGNENFEQELIAAVSVLDEANLQTAKTEIREAINDLSRRPEADITGSIQHSVASLECVAREVTGDLSLTLGNLIKKHPDIVPKPVDDIIAKIWGFSSEQGRHLREGREPNFEEAELIVSLSAALTTYLSKKHIINP